ncbi:type I secretion system permease/ATPase [Pararhizobium mangrovi]|uniref:Type I secretion system permease/ATPase n=1 Tax=Pararhizobium mangrovi TaxID=2590452 RepID=A0A506U2B9_9HYPH|nr:type I secretion system permease/ATPase [Pararhizobium mangrovi]TPW27940.1 type I secretion system permease/ATPase [Pararhizobium mangrovi]
MNRSSDRLLRIVRTAAFRLAGLGLVINVLLLVQPLYMLQVYDRILQSRSLDTLVYISILAAGAVMLLGLLDAIRTLMATRIGVHLAVAAGDTAVVACMRGRKAGLGDIQPLRDLETVRNFLGGRGAFAFLDLPFTPLFLLLLYFIHPLLCLVASLGAAVLMLIAFANQRFSAKPSAEVAEQNTAAMLSAQAIARNAESIEAMGMTRSAIGAWGGSAARHLHVQNTLGRTNAVFSGISRAFRIALQIAILGIGGYLVLQGEMTAGMIFASSLISGRALQPIDQIIGGWKGAIEASRAWSRLKAKLDTADDEERRTELPTPTGHITLEDVLALPADDPTGEPLLRRISAVVEAGTFLAIVGPSGAGKSTLLRAMIGAVPLRAGAVRIDGADIRQWNREQLGRHVGYLAQDVELLPGTVAQNIARFDPHATDEAIVEAARKAHVHELVVGLPKGYDTPVGPSGLRLSGGQRQRIGLARAFFGEPRLLLLDEPNANLDAEGEAALESALQAAHEAGVTIVAVTQRRHLAKQAGTIMIIRNGALESFGEKKRILGADSPMLAAASRGNETGKEPSDASRAQAGERPRLPTTVAGGARG